MRFLRYAWPAILLVAAILSPSLTVTITLLIGALLSLALITPKILEPTLNRTRRHLLFTAAAGELLIFICLLSGQLDITVARNYALLVLIAAAPLGLELTLAWLLHLKHKHESETIRTAIGYAGEDAHALTAIIGLSLLGTLIFDIPPALSAMQLLFITCVARPLLSGRALQATPHKVDQLWRVLFTSLTVYGSFIFFFIRHYIEPHYADSINPVTWQATTLALAVFVACQAALLVFNPRAPKVIVYRSLVLLGLALVVSYLPLTQDYLMTAGLAAADWVWVIIAGLFYTSLCLLQRQSALHSRKSVIALHRN